MLVRPRAAALALSLSLLSLTAQAPPTVTRLLPAHGDVEVDPTTVTELVVEFDQPMAQGGFSFCGGGPQFPTIPAGKQPFWRDARTCVLPVALAADHGYSLSVNCPAAQNFRSADGVAATPTPWSFATLPAELPPRKQQQARNRAALAELQKVLERHYAYYDLRGLAWQKLFREHRTALLDARTTRGWAQRAATMLQPTEDLHLFLRLDGTVYPAGRRAVDPLYRVEHLGVALGNLRKHSPHCLTALTEDRIGYLMVSTFGRELDIEAVEQALAQLLAEQPKAMVVDVRPNAGGDELLARRVAAWFVQGTKVYAKNRTRTGKGERGFGPVLERPLTGNPDDRRFAVPLVVLTSRYVMSSAEAFVLMLRQADDCTQVGQPTYGSSGNPKPHQLSNGVIVMVPSWQALRPDGSCFEGEGIAPDVLVEVTPAELSGGDPILQRGLEHLRERLR